jgi:hypothetical protein
LEPRRGSETLDECQCECPGNETRSGFGTHALSQIDPFGWKIAYVAVDDPGESAGLYLSNLDPTTLACSQATVEIVPPCALNPFDIALAYSGFLHVIVWIEHDGGVKRLKMGRFMPDMTILDPGGIELAVGVNACAMDVSLVSSGGLISWVSSTGQVMVLPLDSDWLPSGEPAEIVQGVSADHSQVAVAPLGENWLVTWASGWGDPPWFACINAGGQGLGTGPVQLSEGSAFWGLDASSSATSGFICWRSGTWDFVRGSRISLDGAILDSTPILISNEDVFECWEPEFLRRNLACAWTGQHYVVEWNTWYEEWLPSDKRRGERRDPHPIYAQWIDETGQLLYTDPIKLNEGSWPNRIVSEFVGDGILNVISDGASAKYLHVVKTDSLGVPAEEPVRISATYEGERIRGLESRPWDDGAAIVFDWSGRNEYYQDWTNLEVLRFDQEGNATSSGTVAIGWEDHDASTDCWDIAASSDSVFVVYDRQFQHQPKQVKAEFIDGPAWSVVPTGIEPYQPTTVKVGNEYLMVWVEDNVEERQLYKAIVDPENPRYVLWGEPLWEVNAAQAQPHLAQGPGHLLCVFGMYLPEVSNNTDIYGLRLDYNGVPLDSEPILIADYDLGLSFPRAIWDGWNYVITWQAPDKEYAVFTGRMTAEGELLDGEGVFLGNGGSSRRFARLTTNGEGVVAVSYGTQTLQIILDEPMSAVDDPQVPDNSTFLDLRVSEPWPNPVSESVKIHLNCRSIPRLSAQILDSSGRKLVSLHETVVNGEGTIEWGGRLPNGRRVPAGVYFIKVAGPSRSVTRRFVVVR